MSEPSAAAKRIAEKIRQFIFINPAPVGGYVISQEMLIALIDAELAAERQAAEGMAKAWTRALAGENKADCHLCRIRIMEQLPGICFMCEGREALAAYERATGKGG